MSDYTYNDSAAVDINNPDFGDDGERKKSDRKAISDAGQALAIATRLVWDDRERDAMRAKVLGAFNGEPPYSDSTLRAKAQAYRYNVSFGFMEGVVGRAVVPYNDLTLNVDDLAQIDADLPDNKLNIMREEFAKQIKNHGGWPKFISRLNQDLVLNGYNQALFPSDYDFFPTFVPQKDGFVHDGSLNGVKDLDVFVWRHDYLIHELYNKIEDSKTADKAGWNVKNVRQALMNASPKDLWTNNVNGSGTWLAVEEAIRGGSLHSSMVGAKMVQAYHVLASEIDGQVTHYIVLNDGSASGNSDNQGIELFKKEKRFNSFEDILVYFDIETGDGNWHGSRGLGRRIFNTHKAIDKLRCSALDQAFVSGLTILQPGDQASQEDFQLAVIGPFAVIPSGISVATTTLPALSQTTFAADNLLSATSEQRVGDVVPSSGSPQGGDKTATEARIAASRQQLIGRGNLQRYLDPLSAVLSIMLRRLLKSNSPDTYAEKFQNALRKRGLDEEDFKKVKGAKSSGRIDDVLGEAQANTQVVFAEFRGDPEIDQIELKRRRITSILGAKEAEDLLLGQEDKTKTLEAARQQTEELGTILQGFPVPASPRDNQEVHLQVAMQWLDGQIQIISQGQPGQPIDVLKGVLEHIAQHAKILEADKMKKAISQQINRDIAAIGKNIVELEKQEARLAEMQQQELQQRQDAEQASLMQEPAPVPQVPMAI